MLELIQIHNFTLIENQSLKFEAGMTVLTGETGAGKSIFIEALLIALGQRADISCIGPHDDHCDITIGFSIDDISKTWLESNDLYEEDACLLRRVIRKDGRTRAYINGHPVTNGQIKTLATHLISIHGQHESQALFDTNTHRDILDRFAHIAPELKEIRALFKQIQTLQKELKEWNDQQQQGKERHALQHYQLEELLRLGLQENEYETLSNEQKTLSHCQELLQTIEESQSLLEGAEQGNIQSLMHSLLKSLYQAANYDPRFQNSIQWTEQANTLLQEVHHELNHLSQNIHLNPERLAQVEARLESCHTLARKHKTTPTLLYSFQKDLEQQLQSSFQQTEHLQQLEETLQKTLNLYFEKAEILHEKRTTALRQLEKLMTEKMHLLGMQKGAFQVDIHYSKQNSLTEFGLDQVQFCVCTNVGMPFEPIQKIASGGELSRLSLALQTLTHTTDRHLPIIFDEVDVGIGGATAEIVGKLLRQLSTHTQVICITHLPQVASQGNHHFRVEKGMKNNKTHTSIVSLNPEERIQEIGRMLGGVHISPHVLAHATELLTSSNTPVRDPS